MTDTGQQPTWKRLLRSSSTESVTELSGSAWTAWWMLTSVHSTGTSLIGLPIWVASASHAVTRYEVACKRQPVQSPWEFVHQVIS